MLLKRWQTGFIGLLQADKVVLRAYFVKNMFVVWQPIYAVAVATSIKAIPQTLRLPIRGKAIEEGALHFLFFVTSLFSTLTLPL